MSIKSALAQSVQGTDELHRENREMKAEVLNWLDANMHSFKSMDKAADAMIEKKIVPVTWRTLRGWVGEWKKLRSAGAP